MLTAAFISLSWCAPQAGQFHSLTFRSLTAEFFVPQTLQVWVANSRINSQVCATYIINAIQRNGWGALHYAAVHGTIGLMTKLLKNGADPDIKDRRGDTPYGIWLRSADQGKRAQYKDKLEEEIRKAQEKTAKKRQETDPGPEL